MHQKEQEVNPEQSVKVAGGGCTLETPDEVGLCRVVLGTAVWWHRWKSMARGFVAAMMLALINKTKGN